MDEAAWPVPPRRTRSWEVSPSPHPAAGEVARCVEIQALARELDQLQMLIQDAGTRLAAAFGTMASGSGALRVAALDEAVIALQFQDIATQLIGHARERVSRLAYRPRDDAGATRQRNPVGQFAMHDGDIELFE